MALVIRIEDVIELVESGRIDAYLPGLTHDLVEDISEIHPGKEFYLIFRKNYILDIYGDLCPEDLYQLMISERLPVKDGIVIYPHVIHKVKR